MTGSTAPRPTITRSATTTVPATVVPPVALAALAKRTCRFFVYAHDLSGSGQTRVGSNRLVVR